MGILWIDSRIKEIDRQVEVLHKERERLKQLQSYISKCPACQGSGIKIKFPCSKHFTFVDCQKCEGSGIET